jgi:glycosyltransferase involved in cell wall biosynthesis
MRRYFDDYRGLRDTTGHVEPLSLRDALGHIRRSVRGDIRWLQQQGASAGDVARWSVPSAARARLSLERRDGAALPVEAAWPGGKTASADGIPARPESRLIGQENVTPSGEGEYSAAAEVWRRGPAPLLDPVDGLSQLRRLRIAMVIPPFSRGSGGHSLLMQIFIRLERRGHICSVWVHDDAGQVPHVPAGKLRSDIREFFAPIDGPVYNGLDDWHGADVVLATGWQTAHPVLLLDRCFAKLYVVNDHEPEFYATSAESMLAADTYRHGLHCVAGSPWLRDLLVDRYGASAEAFEYGVEHEIYRPRPMRRRTDTVIYYARSETARRAVPIGLMALAELHRRRPDVRIALFGSGLPTRTSFPHVQLGILNPTELSWLYSEATAGLCLSLTNFSLMPKEMMACGLPCVEVAGASAESIFGRSGPLELAELNPSAIADALERLLSDRERWGLRSQAGLEFVQVHTWDRAADQVESAIRHALALREGRVPQGVAA